ncbi:MAG: hypothetical protein WD448_11860 [Woeseia sp.]
MAEADNIETAPEWIEEDPEIALTMEMDDEELEFEEFPDEEAAVKPVVEGPREHVPLWRLIEMSREDRSLRMELADFDSYDVFDDSPDADSNYSGIVSH